EPFVAGIGHIDFSVLIPGGIGAVATVILLSRAINALFKRYYSLAFHSIIGIVIAATIIIIPFRSFTESTAAFIINLLCLAFGLIASLLLDNFNRKF
ncbi:MAG: undecaprenyl phosphate translocase family protein, partial [Lachnospiraceae bacterium]